MNIGDKVRLVHGREEGIISRFLPGNQVEIEIEDGFRIPAMRHEVVLVSPMEGQRMKKAEEKDKIVPRSGAAPRPAGSFAEKGIYLVFVPINDRELTVHLVNNTDWLLPFVAASDHEGTHQGLVGGTLNARSSQKISDLLIKDFEQWPTFDFQVLHFRPGTFTARAPFLKRIKCRAQSFYKKKSQAPVLLKEAYVYQLDEDGEVAAPAGNISPQELRERMLSPEPLKVPPSRPVTAPTTVDLHIEKLLPEYAKLPKEEILTIQLKTFEQQLEQAIAGGADEMTFIHGVGNGVLRSELHRRLGQHQHVQYYQDAQKEKFGYGATLVKIK
ncbi:hypothetical protein GCM10027275_20230 [Rhabdobacter roseus]|uniref:Smr domain-containing protein n=1 Tax=Rhabdobacter roseus TaxID=1655419 RepID=A0A840TKL5_9BACT|nr:DUF2027 domain-containing protein [Rhabdobacter roseus]MBB5283954.1 hypothetical protein [Rhabdobacter roseus]